MSEPDEHQTLSGSITRLIRMLPNSDHHSARRLFDFYRDRLVALARKRLGDADRRFRDEDDIVGEVLAQFLLDGGHGQLPLINNRTDVLRMLYQRINLRVKNHVRDANRLKRGGGKVANESAVAAPEGQSSFGLDSLPGESRPPDAALIDLEELQSLNERIIQCLPDDKLRNFADCWLQGLVPSEIAKQLKVSQSTVYRKMDVVLEALRREFSE